jgi:YrbI family 3-deoxy-D-manno-octulosonate 8-phosphate phosphatase
MNTACIIPARGGSKGLPGKNTRSFLGKPLLAWSIQRARQCPDFDYGVWVSTDSEEIAEVSRSFGAEVVWRPTELAGDDSPSEAALIHSLQHIEAIRGGKIETLVFLQATSPLRMPFDISRALRQFKEEDLDSLFSAAVLEDFTLWTRRGGRLESTSYDWRNRGLRQNREPQILENGSIYICRRSIVADTGNRLGGRIGIYVMPYRQSFEIDSLEDFELCEAMAREMQLSWKIAGKPSDLAAVIMDFDGVFTDNAVYLDETGREMARCNRSDGLGLARLRQARPDLMLLILSSEANAIVQVRAKKLGLNSVHGIADKLSYLKNFCTERRLSPSQVAYVGNDLNDLECMRFVGFSFAPADAVPAVVCEADCVLKHKGGQGALREMCELLISWTLPAASKTEALHEEA